MPPDGKTLKITVLGSGTSVGVPTIGCRCGVCLSQDPRDARLRPSVLLSYGGRNVLIDSAPDLRQQALRAKMDRLDAILFTHAHADHILGLDDVRPFNYGRKEPIPAYGSETTIALIRGTFAYIFDSGPKESSVPRILTRVLDGGPLELFGRRFLPVPLRHGGSTVHGFRFGAAAYLTDHSEIPEESLAQLAGLDVLFLDGLRHRPHPTHNTVAQALEYVERLAPRRAFLTHICHELPHEETERHLPPRVRLAYDGLEVEVAE
jgi:phosphoribosyl 1,2-cyclic phosphate phosphodiesterase